MTASPAVVLAEREAPFWGFGEIFIVIAIGMSAMAVIGSSAMAILHENARLGYWEVAQEFLGYAVIFTAMKLLFMRYNQPLLASLAFVRSPFRTGTLIYTGLALVALTIVVASLARTPNVETPFQEMLNGSNLSRVVIALFGISLGPMIEELLFRGFMQPVLANAMGVFPGILLTSLVFGALHLQQNANIWQSGFVISIAGFVFGVVRHISGSTRASTVTHIAYNLVPCVATLMEPFHK